MNAYARIAAGLMAAVALAGCVSTPTGPTVAVMPGAGKSFDAFQADDAVCKNFAQQSVGNSANGANNQEIGTAILGTVLGAGLGAAIGGGTGAAVGAGSGAIGGTAIGGSNAGGSQRSLQQRYNIAYEQCMSSKGDRLPHPASVTYYSPYYAAPSATVVPPSPTPAPAPGSTASTQTVTPH